IHYRSISNSFLLTHYDQLTSTPFPYTTLFRSHADKVTGAVREVFATMQPLPRAGETEDIARACAYLASDASGFINGIDLPVDGGDRKSTRLNSSHGSISYAVFCLKKKN